MPKLQTNAQRRGRYEMIARVEGEQCLACYIEKGKRRGPPAAELQIDHADNNERNWDWHNLHLLCRSHNCKFRGRDHSALFQSYSDQLERERERDNLPTRKTVMKDEIAYEDGSPEMRANRRFEVLWLRYVHKVVKEEGSALRKEIISGGAAASNCSIQTSTKYLIKYTSPISPFMEKPDGDGDTVIVYRPIRKAKVEGGSKCLTPKASN